MRLDRPLLVGIALAAVISGCGDNKPEERDRGDHLPKPPATQPDAVTRNAATVLAQLVNLESSADVTCWTSFRQLDWFIAEKSYSEFATLAKITAVKALVRAAWARASAQAKGGVISAADFDAAVTLPTVALAQDQKDELVSFADEVGLRNFSDYQKTAEHLRVVLSVLQDEIYRRPSAPLKPLDDEAVDRLADAATTLSLLLLKQSGQIAEAGKSQFIEGEHVQQAYKQISEAHNLRNPPRKVERLTREQIARQLAPLSGVLIEGKAKALRSFNKSSQQVVTDLNRIAPVPITEQGLEVLYARLRSFARFVARGFDPMRADNFLLDGSFVKSKLRTRDYIDSVYVQNTVMQIFPHRILNNGDVEVRFEPNPGPMTAELKLSPFEIRLQDHWMNGVRDSAIHWIVLREEWSSSSFAIDPFAAEYLSEVLSMMMTLYLKRGEQVAKELGKTEIDAEVAKRVDSKNWIMVPPAQTEQVQWNDERKKAKAKAMAPLGATLFRDVSAAAGLPTRFDKPSGAFEGTLDLQRIMGGGIAVGDVNADGYPDLYLTGEALGRLYINGGKSAPGKFVDSTEAWGLPTDLHDGHGTLMFDLEGDGDVDLLVLRSEHPSALFIQDGKKFTDAAKKLGFQTSRGAHVASVFDYDRDGDLDIYVGYYGSSEANTGAGKVRSLPSLDGQNGSPNQLWKQDSGKLVEVAARAGVDTRGWTLAAGAFDYEMDGDLDLYVANDFGANVLYRNDGNGTFTDITAETNTGDRGSGMNVDVSDVNADGHWDLYVTNIDMFSKRIKVVFPRDESTIDIDESLIRAFQYLSGNKLYVSAEKARLRAEEGARFEPGDRGWGWDAGFFDYENDGDDDMYMTNGWITGSYAGDQKNQMYVNDGGFYYLAPPKSAEAFAGNTRSAAQIDFDRDGDIDLVTNNFRGPPVVLQNVQTLKNRWIRLELLGAAPNPGAVGAIAIVEARGLRVMRHVTAGRGYLGQAELPITVGVGKAAKVDVTVKWPDGTEQKLQGLPTNRAHTIDKP